MKATMRDNQVLPVKLSSKDPAAHKDAVARPSAQRFDDVLSKVKAASRTAGRGTIPHRPADPLAKLPMTQAAETRRIESEDSEGVSAAESEFSLAAPHATDRPPDIVASELLPLPAMANRSTPSATRPMPTTSGGFSSGQNVSGASRVERESVDKKAVPRVGAVRNAETSPSDRTHAGKASSLGQESPAALPRRSTEMAVHKVDPASMGAGLPFAPAQGATVDAYSGAAISNAATRPGAGFSVPRGARPFDAAAMIGSRTGPEVTAGAEISPGQPTGFATAPTREPRRAPIAATRVAPPLDIAGAMADRDSPTNTGDEVSVVAQEKHFQPVTAVRDIRLPPAARIEATLAPHAERSSAVHADRKAPDAHKASVAPGAEPQSRTATSAAPPLVQLASAIMQEIGAAVPEPVDTVASASAPTLQADGREPLRLLRVALDPPELGRVHVRLRLTGRALEVTVTAERPETASLLDRDRHVLARILHGSGYSAEDISVQTQSATLQTTAPTLRAADAQTGNQAAPQFQSGAWAEDERQSPPRPQDSGRGQSPQETQVDEANSDTRRGGDLYV